MAITRETLIGDVLELAPDAVPLFFEMGMHCLGCALANGETVGEACEVHGVDVDPFLAVLNTYVKE